jgi:hypothetical protein
MLKVVNFMKQLKEAPTTGAMLASMGAGGNYGSGSSSSSSSGGSISNANGSAPTGDGRQQEQEIKRKKPSSNPKVCWKCGKSKHKDGKCKGPACDSFTGHIQWDSNKNEWALTNFKAKHSNAGMPYFETLKEKFGTAYWWQGKQWTESELAKEWKANGLEKAKQACHALLVNINHATVTCTDLFRGFLHLELGVRTGVRRSAKWHLISY